MAYHFLVIDDEKDILEIIEFYLKELYPNSHIETFTEPAKALTRAEKQSYDVIFTDFKMPRVNGVDLIKKIRNSEGPNKNTGVLIVTAKGDLVELELGELDNTLILDKPINKNRLAANTKIFISLNMS